jgi:hypothetical protein
VIGLLLVDNGVVVGRIFFLDAVGPYTMAPRRARLRSNARDCDMTEHPAYMPRIVGNRLVTPAELKRLHEQLLKNDEIEVIADDMRAVVESEWPELTYNLPAKEGLGTVKNLPKKRAFGWWARYLLSVAAEIAIVAWGVVVAAAVLWAFFEEPD